MARASTWMLLAGTIVAIGCGGGADGAASDASPGGATPTAPTPTPTAPPAEVLPPGTIRVEGGLVSGALVDGVWAWKGIPFAAPPVGDLRWRAPAPVIPWEGVRPAVDLGPRCPQLDRDGLAVGNEDCLTLNVWVPEGVRAAPTLVRIDGGGNVQGSAAEPLYDGARLAAQTRSAVVTIQYRVGALGFFVHDGLAGESPANVSGNYGISDQRAALAWVKANIAGFGGDAGKVLLFGESAGGQNTLVHVVSPLSAGLFHAAVVQSGGAYKTTLAEARAAHVALVEAVGCADETDVVGCMRGRRAEELVRVPSALGPLDREGLRYNPVVDGHVLPRDAFAAIESDEYNHVPIILGTNADETSQMAPPARNQAEYVAALTTLYGATAAAAVKDVYTAERFGSHRQALIALTTDATWTCPARRLARSLSARQTEGVYRYFFSWKTDGLGGRVVGATHGLEIPFVFDTFAAFGGFEPPPSAVALSSAMQGYWSRLASAGDPNAPGAERWPRYEAASDPYVQLDVAIEAKAGLRTSDCDLIDSLAP